MSQPSTSAVRAEVQALYRAYLRVVNQWPEDKLRPTRDMKHVLQTRVEETFRKPLQSEGELDMAAAKMQLDALTRLVNNEFKNQYPLSNKILSPASNPNYYSRLIASLEASKGPKKSFFARLLGQ